MNNWEFIEAEKLYKKVTDGTHDSPKYTSEGYPLVTSKNIKDGVLDLSTVNLISNIDYDEINKRSKVEQWDVIISMIGEYCGYTYIEKNTLIKYAVKNVGLFKTCSELEANWLSYYLKSDFGKHFLKQSRSGSSQPYISLGALRGLKILNPSIEIKEGIVNSIKPIDDKIELNNRINAELEAMAKTLYDYWFVQFEFPIEAALAAKMGDPNLIGKPYKTSGGKMVWNEELKREIPEGWEVKKIGEIATVKAGGDKPENYTIEKTEINTIPIYSNGITNDGLYGYTRKSIISDQSVTISARGTIGFCVLRNKPYLPIIRLISLTPHLKGSAKYFYETLKDFIFENSGSVQQQLTVPQVTGIKIIYPNEDVLIRFDEITSPMIERIEIIKEENQKLTELRDWLLPMLMNGQVKVSER